jgi:hypothetical protein
MGDGNLDSYPIVQDQTSPNLAHIPTTNLLTYSEDFSQSYWSKLNGVTVTGSTIISPIGTNNAQGLQFDGTSNGRLERGLNSGELVAGDRSLSVYVKVASGTANASVGFSTGSNTSFTINTEWKKIKHTQSSSDFPRLRCDENKLIYVWGIQAEQQSQATAYIKSDGIAAVRKSSTTNKFIYSEDFENALFVWLKAGTVTPTSNYGVSPDGTQNSTRLVFGSSNNAFYKYSLHSGNTEANSIYVKGVSGETIKFGKGTTVNTGEVFTLNGNWQRLEYISTTGNQFTINTYSGATARDIQIWGVQIEEQTQAETYAKTTGLPVTIDLFKENNYGTMTNMSESDIVIDTPGVS